MNYLYNMNFLSHYYFDKTNLNSNIVVGTVLPDLVKNANKAWNLYPQKNEALGNSSIAINDLLIGWKRHLKVDLLFHSSTFFTTQTAVLKQLLLPILIDSPVRPSFLAHIGLELVIDHLLVCEKKLDIKQFYVHLNNIDDCLLDEFFRLSGLKETEKFFKFFNSFKTSEYLYSYEKPENISYALQRICMRLWAHPFSEETVSLLAEKLQIFIKMIKKDYLSIFIEIEPKLNEK